MKTSSYLWQLIRYRPVLFAFDVFIWLLVSLSPIIPGLIIQQFFNRLPQVGHLTPELWLLATLPVAIALARAVLYFVGAWIDPLHRTYMYGLLQRNLLGDRCDRDGDDCHSRDHSPAQDRWLDYAAGLRAAGRHCVHHSDDEKAFTSLPERQPPGNWTRHWFYR